MRQRAIASIAILAAALAASAPALAHDHGGAPMPPPGWQGAYQGGPDWDRQRDDWLRECRKRLGDNGVGGAVIGGIIGGVAGHEIAGRGNRAVGTIAGAAVGAVAGAAIDKAEDRGRVNDRCEAMLQGQYGYGAGYGGYGYGYPAYGYAYAPMMMMVPVMMVPAQAPATAPRPECKETVVTEYVTTYEPVRQRVIRPRPAPHYKRVPVVPDKRVRMVPDKRIKGS